MRRLVFSLTLALAALPASASNQLCNATLVTQGVCRSATNTVLYYDAPTATLVDLRDAIAGLENYQTQVTCRATRQFDTLENGQPSKVLVAAGVDVDLCVLGTVVTNPQTSTQFADAIVDRLLRNKVIRWKHQVAVSQASDITTIPTPDVGGN